MPTNNAAIRLYLCIHTWSWFLSGYTVHTYLFLIVVESPLQWLLSPYLVGTACAE